jgi:uncharacterized membrane protein YgcG
MNAGPGGFADAPVTKAIVLASAAASILANAGRGGSGTSAAAAAALDALPGPLRPLAFASTGEMLTGLAMLYSGRLIERQSGSSQYGAYAAVVAGAAALLQAALSAAVGGAPSPPSSLPLAFAFAGLVPFAADVPPQAHFSFLGIPCTDKVFGYLAAAHAIWAAGARRGLLAAAAGLAAGLLYRLNFLGVQRLRLPKWLGGGGGRGGASSSSSGGCPPPRVIVPPVLDPASAAAAGFGGDFGGGGGARGAEQLQARPQMVRRRR